MNGLRARGVVPTILASLVAFLLGLAGGRANPQPTSADAAEGGDLPPPFIFSLGGLEPDQIAELKKVPGVKEVVMEHGRVRVAWQLWRARGEQLPLADLNQLHGFLALTKRLGRTLYTHGGAYDGRGGSILRSVRGEVRFCMMFDDGTTKHNEVLSLYLYCQPQPGQLEHEMLRNVPGTRVSIEKCGDGYIILSYPSSLPSVFWQVSDQMFVRIDNSFDREMVAAYVNRLGSITPKGYEISVDKWVANEIRWRLQLLDARYRRRAEHRFTRSVIWGPSSDVSTCFPEVNAKVTALKPDSVLDDEFDYLHKLRRWLWANRENFKYDYPTRGYVLKGPDRYDPKNPPELPEELKDPPRPSEFKPPAKPAPAKPKPKAK